jgi:hypothetical protein
MNDYLQKYGERRRQCFELAGKFVINNIGWELIHARLSSESGDSTDRAFVEKGESVYDPASGRFSDRQDFYRQFPPGLTHRYTRKEAAERLVKYKHWGPWPTG